MKRRILIICFVLALGMLLGGVACAEYEREAPMAVDPEPLHLYMYDEYKVGMRLLFGGYEQNGSDNDGKEDIEWLVLDIVDGKALLISVNGLDVIPYNTTVPLVNIYWEDSNLYQWLNNEFYDTAFAVYEKAIICNMAIDETLVSETESADLSEETADELPTETEGEPSEEDESAPDEAENELPKEFVSALSESELETYLPDSSDRKCFPSAYAAKKAGWQQNSPSMWFLKPPSEFTAYGQFVTTDGRSLLATEAQAFILVRPIIWVNLPKT